MNSLFPSNQKGETVVTIPKFKMEMEFDNLKKIMQKMGIKKIFTDAADLSGMAKRPLKVSDIIQKCVIKVNEEGSEAAAATAVAIQNKSEDVLPTPKFNANKPFLYFIVERSSGMILFSGRLVDPSKAVHE